jgi:focal adhesion kinase 1
MEPTPTADLDRSNDKVYDCTTNVVKAVMSLSQGKFCLVVSDIISHIYPVGKELLVCIA